MSSFRLASRYAKSLLQLAQEKGQLEAVKSDIELLNSAFSGSRELRTMLKSPVIPTDKKQIVLTKIFGGKLSEITTRFVTLLTSKGREQFLGEVADAFIAQYNVLNKITKVKIVTATETDKTALDKIVDGLKKKEKLSEVELEHAVDASLIGGFVITYGDKQIDTSVKASLAKLKTVVADDSYIKKIK